MVRSLLVSGLEMIQIDQDIQIYLFESVLEVCWFHCWYGRYSSEMLFSIDVSAQLVFSLRLAKHVYTFAN